MITMNKKRIHESIRILKKKKKNVGRALLHRKMPPNKRRRNERTGKTSFATTNVISDSAKIIHGC